MDALHVPIPPAMKGATRLTSVATRYQYLTMVRESDSHYVALVRRFNRTVTERIGALGETFLGRDRPLGASRLLWEIGEYGADLNELRDRLGLDSGYASRLVRRLEGEGLVAVEASPPTGAGADSASRPRGSRRCGS